MVDMMNIDKDDFQVRVTARVVFAHSRFEFLENWKVSYDLRNKNTMDHWAQRIREVNDSELALVGPSW